LPDRKADVLLLNLKIASATLVSELINVAAGLAPYVGSPAIYDQFRPRLVLRDEGQEDALASNGSVTVFAPALVPST
jgi:hypothetical protein